MPISVSLMLKHVEGLKFDIEMEDGRIVKLDSEHVGSAFAPMELFLAGLAGCTAMELQWILNRQRQKVRRLEMSVRGTRRDEDPRFYERIEVDCNLEGPNIRKDAVEKAIRLSQEKYCSVRAMLNDRVKVSINCRISSDGKPEQNFVYPIPLA